MQPSTIKHCIMLSILGDGVVHPGPEHAVVHPPNVHAVVHPVIAVHAVVGGNHAVHGVVMPSSVKPQHTGQPVFHASKHSAVPPNNSICAIVHGKPYISEHVAPHAVLNGDVAP